MSGNLELSNSMAAIDDSRPDGEGFTDWRSSESSRETASSSATTVDDSLSEGDGFIAQTPGEGGPRPVFIAGSEQGSEALHPVQGLESLSLTEDVEMTGCEPVGNSRRSRWTGSGRRLPPSIRAANPPRSHHSKSNINFTQIDEGAGGSESQPPLRELWEILVGVYFSEVRQPCAHLGYDREAREVIPGECWEWNWALQDIREQSTGMTPASYTMPSGQEGEFLEAIATSILDGNENLFLAAIKRWQLEGMARCCNVASTREWHLMAEIKKLPEEPHKTELLQQAIQEPPRFAWRCIDDPSCMLVPPSKYFVVIVVV
ncbi:hypothetical protein EMCG_05292 [[Emmonsia] crescens]|uniref:Uncharacterized protein n=1 Tax=[Emmonsia] crescens TaxID=73230 RepID=A0A0G2J6C2_9EURO|nr:hypothetical protein EMCG_05292 [Emmonsia crescens UAMH 3008]